MLSGKGEGGSEARPSLGVEPRNEGDDHMTDIEKERTSERRPAGAYDEGMFTSEPPCRLTQLFGEIAAVGATCHREAGHVVLDYALGAGVGDIQLRVTNTPRPSGEGFEASHHGMVSHTKEFRERVENSLRHGSYDRTLLAYGVSAAAGPAAERKFCHSEGLAIRTRGGSDGDEHAIDKTCIALAMAGRSPAAYRRLVWRWAQMALENKQIWEAVSELALQLEDYWPDDPADNDIGVKSGGASAFGVMPSKAVEDTMRKAGAYPGILGWRI